VRQYGPDLIEITWAVVNVVPVNLKEGLAAGPFIQPARSTQRWTQRHDGMGGVVRFYNPNRSGALTILIDQESQTHQRLITLSNIDEVARAIVGPIVVRDGNNREVNVYTKAYIVSQPDIPKGQTAGIVPWIWNYQGQTTQPFDFDANAVGA
jgi:hypothetical protein